MRADILGLKYFCALEHMAVEIYLSQLWRFRGTEVEKIIQDSADNEATHRDKLIRRLKDKGSQPPLLRYLFILMGKTIFGAFPALMGKWAIYTANILFERMAVWEYGEFLDRIKLDEESRALLRELREDEVRHVATYKALRNKGKS